MTAVTSGFVGAKVDVALLAGFTRANLKQTLKKAVAQKDLEAEALPPLSEDGLDLEFLCVAVCSKQVVASCLAALADIFQSTPPSPARAL